MNIKVNKAHSVGYGLLSFITAYLKHYHTLEFQTSLLNSVIGDTGDTTKYIDDSINNNINVLPPHINKSQLNFSCNKKHNSILIGLNAIKSMGVDICKEIIEKRPFKSLEHLNSVIKLNVSQHVTLIKSGAIGKNKTKLIEEFLDNNTIKQEYKDVKTMPKLSVLREKFGIDSDDKDERLSMYNQIKKQMFVKELELKSKNKKDEIMEKYFKDEYRFEYDSIGFFVSYNPFKGIDVIHTDDIGCNIPNLTTVGFISEIVNKKDKNGNKYVLLKILSKHGEVIGTVFSTHFSKYSNVIKKNNCCVFMGKWQNDSKAYLVSEIKLFEEWKNEKSVDKSIK